VLIRILLIYLSWIFTESQSNMSRKAWPILILTLPGQEERRSGLIAQLDSIGINYEIFMGADCRNGVPSLFEGYLDRDGMRNDFGRELSDPEIGRALSHILAYQRIVDSQLPGALIFEEDAAIQCEETFKKFYMRLGDLTGDFWQLSYGYARRWRLGLGRSRDHGLQFERLIHNSGRATGYALSVSAAEYLLGHALPLRCVPDWPCDLMPLRPKAIVPRLVIGDDDPEKSLLQTSRVKSQVTAKRVRGSRSKSSLRQKRQSIRNPKPRLYSYFHRWLSVPF
jgi:GR25 family glycosyltransferase involved in LPS biosynthesis